MNKDLRTRLAKLEGRLHGDPIVLHYDGKRPPVSIAGTSRNFFRLMNVFSRGKGDTDVTALKNATRIEGRAQQLFALAHSLMQGPVRRSAPTTQNPQPNIEEKSQ